MIHHNATTYQRNAGESTVSDIEQAVEERLIGKRGVLEIAEELRRKLDELDALNRR